MRRTLIVSSLAIIASIGSHAQTPAPAPAPAPPATAPKPAAPRAPAAARPAILTIQVTDTLGAPLADTQVTLTGPAARDGVTTSDGELRLSNMRAGTYRLRFVREGSITFERELAMRAGESLELNVSLSPAPVVPKEPEPVQPPPEPETKALPPPGDPKITPVPLFLEKNFIGGREGRKDSPLGCTPTGTATLHQIREAWLSHTHEDADEWIYVVAGEGALRLGNAPDQRVQAGTFSLVPYATPHALLPQGRNPLIIISVLSGPACKS
jgi:mannose-6-phosphate isomerase-like protein (cupin superfamily)